MEYDNYHFLFVIEIVEIITKNCYRSAKYHIQIVNFSALTNDRRIKKLH